MAFFFRRYFPNNLSVNKINALQDWWNDYTANQSKIVEKLGLRVTYNDNQINYSYNISLVNFSARYGEPPQNAVTVTRLVTLVVKSTGRSLRSPAHAMVTFREFVWRCWMQDTGFDLHFTSCIFTVSRGNYGALPHVPASPERAYV